MKDWASLIGESIDEQADKVPDGYMSRSQLEAVWKVKCAQAGRRITVMLGQGLIERKDFRIVVNGTIRTVPHYRATS